MRAKVAKSVGGHALEEKFLKLNGLKLALLYRQAIKEENDEKKEKNEAVKAINSAWSNKFDSLFEMLQLFVNPKMYKNLMDLRDVKDLDKVDINVDNFHEEWDKMMEIIPEEYIVEEIGVNSKIKEINDPEFEDLITGWIEGSRTYQERG